MTSDETMDVLTAKVDAFALTLSAAEQVLFAELVGGDGDDAIGAYGARPIWPGLANLLSPMQH